MKTMQAILLDKFGGAENMRIGEAPRPRPGRGQILIKVAAASVNRPDIIQREGNYPPPPGESEILGLEAAGVVEELGEDVTARKTGERVIALLPGGGYAEYALARADHAMPLPHNMDFTAGACICETYLTAYLNLFMIAGLRDGHNVLLHGGGGGVTTAAMQLCRQLTPGARVMVTASPGKVARVRELGAHEVIDYQNESFAERVRALTEKRGADIILDHIGAPYLAPNLQSLAVAGTLMLIGVLGGATAEVNLARVMVKRQRIIGSVLRSRPPQEKANIIAKFAAEVMPHFANGNLAPLISKTYPLPQAADAHRMMESSGHFGKIVLVV